MRLLLGIPTGGAPSQPFLESIAQLVLPSSVTAVDRYVVTGNYVPAQRELIAERALDLGADLLAMCDDDMVVPPDALARLIDVLTADPACGIAGALYYSRDGFRPMAVSRWNDRNTTAATIPAFAHAPVAVDGIGFGCVVLRVSALRALQAPYFPADVYVEREPPRVRVCNEDYRYCSRLRAAGMRAILHAGVRCGHYDRASDVVHPRVWEDDPVTARERVAVVRNGVPQLIAYETLPPGTERHQAVEITYIRPEA